MLAMTDKIHEMVVQKAAARAMRQQAIADGMRTLQECAWEQCKHGMTTLEEIVRLADAIEEDI